MSVAKSASALPGAQREEAASEFGATAKEYLASHKVDVLFTELYEAVVREQPADPLDFLIRTLQSRPS